MLAMLRFASTQRLAMGAPGLLSRNLAGFLECWEHERNPHFCEEETDVLPCHARVADPAHPAVIRMLLAHVLIRGRILVIRELPNPLAPTSMSSAPGLSFTSATRSACCSR